MLPACGLGKHVEFTVVIEYVRPFGGAYSIKRLFQ